MKYRLLDDKETVIRGDQYWDARDGWSEAREGGQLVGKPAGSAEMPVRRPDHLRAEMRKYILEVRHMFESRYRHNQEKLVYSARLIAEIKEELKYEV